MFNVCYLTENIGFYLILFVHEVWVQVISDYLLWSQDACIPTKYKSLYTQRMIQSVTIPNNLKQSDTILCNVLQSDTILYNVI